jgi:hypothetical protein
MTRFSSFVKAEEYPTVNKHYIFITHASISRDLGCFYVLALVNNAIMNMKMYVSFLHTDFISFGHISQNGIGSFIYLFI